jgi:homospermidine synthase
MNNKINFSGNFILLGFGSVASSLIPLLFKHFNLNPAKVTIISGDGRNEKIAKEFGLKINIAPLNFENYKEIINKFVKKGDFLINLSVDVSSLELIKLCAKIEALYLDTCIEPWQGFYTNENLSLEARSNFSLRSEAINLRSTFPKNGTTAVVAHGMNPGMVSHFVKAALVQMAKDKNIFKEIPQSKEEWGRLCEALEVKVIQIAEHDTQISSIPKKQNEFVNTWSVDGLISEGSQPAEMGWGSHEKELPKDGIKHSENAPSIILKTPGIRTKVKSWTPISGTCEAFVITHNEAVSISDYFSTKEGYRPTCYYAYHPCNDAVVSIHEFSGRNYIKQESDRILTNEIISGADELGVLLMGGEKSYWFGSLLEIHEARELAPHNTATSLQITSGVLAGIIWAVNNPNAGIVEAEDMDFESVIETAKPYLGKMIGIYTDFTPLKNRQKLFEEDLDKTDPFQFKNFRVS